MYFTILLIFILFITIFKTEIINFLINLKNNENYISFNFFNLIKDSNILNLIKDSNILNLIKDSNILNLIKDSNILNLIQNSNIFILTNKDTFNYKNILIFLMSTYLFIYSKIYYKILLLLLIIFKQHINKSFYLITKFKKEDFFLNKMIVF